MTKYVPYNCTVAEVSILLGYGDMSLDDWHLMFEDNVKISKSWAPSLSKAVPHLSMKTSTAAVQKPKSVYCNYRYSMV
jgi:hypothetical protein